MKKKKTRLVIKDSVAELKTQVNSSKFKQLMFILSLSVGVNGQTKIWKRLSTHVQDLKGTSLPWIPFNHDGFICCM